MSKHRQSIFESTTLGKLGAVGFYLLLAVALFNAASNMNYSWKWNSVPKYFAYQKVEAVPADFDGTVRIQGKQLTLTADDGKTKVYPIEEEYKPAVDDEDDIYEGDAVLEMTHWVPGPLVNGLIVTLKISALGGLIAFFFASILAFMRISKFPLLQYIASSYITVMRGTPLLVQIFIFYFIIATIFDLPRFYAGAMSLGLFYAAYIAEVLRGAIQSIDQGQHEAAKSLGMNYVQPWAPSSCHKHSREPCLLWWEKSLRWSRTPHWYLSSQLRISQKWAERSWPTLSRPSRHGSS